MSNTNQPATMKDTLRSFSLGSNIMIEIKDGIVRQLDQDGNLIKEIPVAALNEQQVTAMNARREACTAAMIAQGFLPVGSINSK